jgi:hypothetical protein
MVEQAEVQQRSQADLDNLIAMKVAEGISAALPAVLAQINMNQSSEGQFPQGMGPSSQVKMSIGGDNKQNKASYLKHYRLDDAINGKHQLLDVSKIDENGEFIVIKTPDGKIDIPAILKGQYVNFVGGHFYATKQSEVDFIEWKIKRDPQCRIYEDVGGQIIPCAVQNCGQFFGTEDGLTAHMKATHGIGR